jgi:hypothetical protein
VAQVGEVLETEGRVQEIRMVGQGTAAGLRAGNHLSLSLSTPTRLLALRCSRHGSNPLPTPHIPCRVLQTEGVWLE